MPGQFDQKRRHGDLPFPSKADQAAKKEAEEKKDAEGAELEEPQQNRVQNQMGNQAVMSMMSDMAGASGGVEVETQQARKPKPHEKDGVEHGGDDDGDPGPITIHDLALAWNPGMRRVEDKPSFLDPMPDDELPPEDPAFLEAIAACDDPIPVPDGEGVAERIQPSAEVVRIALTPWVRAAGMWADSDPAWQLGRRIVAPPVPALQDPHGRVLLSRSRAASIAVAMLLDAPLVRSHMDAVPALAFALELASRTHRVKAVEVLAEGTRGKELPIALDIFHEHAPPGGDDRAPRPATPTGQGTFARILAGLARYEDIESLVPELAAEAASADPDDPLGLDSVIDTFTGGRPDPQEMLYEAAIQNAERIASAAARSRVLYAGMGVAIAEVAALDGTAPIGGLEAAMAAFDRDVAACLQLLLEIARTAQRRAIPPAGLHAGLRRAAKSLGRLRDHGTQALVEVIWGTLPGDPDLAPPVVDVPEAVQIALAIGQPAEALPWVEAQPASLDRDTALVLLRATAGALAPALIDPVTALRAQWRAHPERLVGTALDVVLGALLLAEGRHDDALRLGDDLLERGRAGRNGLWVTEGALLGIEALFARGDLPAAERRRHRAGHLVRRLGATGALSLLARWKPPEPDDDFA